MSSLEKKPKIAIFGLGAISITIARALYKTKTPFTILCRNEERKSDLSKNPIRFQFRTDPIETLPFYDLAETVLDTKQKFDFIFLGAKSKDLQSAVQSMLPFLNSEGKLILIQNGFPEKKVGLSTKQIIGGVVGWNTQKLASGIYFQSNVGALILGGADGTKPSPYFENILGAFIPTILTDNLDGFRWHKLGINCVINGLSASCMLSLGELMLNQNGRSAGIKILTEVRRAMEKSGVTEAVVPGSISICKLGDGKGALPIWLRHLLLMILGFKYYKIRTSMVQDLDHGRLTEIEDLNGETVRISRSLGLTANTNEAVCHRVRALEQKQIQPNVSFLKELNLLS
ncbi:ketopantoate reductase family protein [Leptospira ognonensis]|uniref:2-dehydropantoate 2-reductase n=1 Tax=Leptospira ognonensis TaxID=2484945 RepID=A0A4R9JYY4_9LEPT|nr:ketopantoate reductase C-terminal domain-containing protein [Leptospira ognonensis]TGL57889.1 ketopantoate reductase family protein [Leptospira ognonensis]